MGKLPVDVTGLRRGRVKPLEIEERRSDADAHAAEIRATGEAAEGPHRCVACGYGVAVYRVLPTCPMCAGDLWAAGRRKYAASFHVVSTSTARGSSDEQPGPGARPPG
jgi:hypothetical protein